MGQKPSEPERNDSQSARDMTQLTYPLSPNAAEGEQVPPYQAAHNPWDQREWNNDDAPSWTYDERDRGNAPLPNPFAYGGPVTANIKPKNVILFGETGVGKSSVINLMAGAEVAPTSPNLNGCTLQSTGYPFVLDGEMSLRIYDTVGLNEPEMGVNTFFGAIEKAHQLVTSLHAAGGIDLLLFCIRGGRITATLQRNYRLFYETLGAKKIPLAFVVTHLDHEDRMEDWWERNQETFQEYDIHSVAHACITAAPARVTTLAGKRQESRYALHRMLHDAFSKPNTPYVNDVRSWFISMLEFFWSILMKSSWLRVKELSQSLETRCGFSRDDAQKLADMIVKSG